MQFIICFATSVHVVGVYFKIGI